MRLLYVILIIVINLSCLSVNSEKSYVKMEKTKFISEYKRLKDNSILIDVRTFDEYKKGTILDDINIDFYDEDFSYEISKLDKSKIIFIFCHSGGRSNKCKKIIYLKRGINKFSIN